MARKRFKIRQVLDAMRKNGFEHARGAWIKDNGKSQAPFGASYGNFETRKKFDAACITMQAALNLGVDAVGLRDRLNYLNGGYAGDAIIQYNDDPYTVHTYDDTVEFAEKVLTPFLDTEIEVAEVDWNRYWDIEGSRKQDAKN
jgi:hypothetical protein